MKASYCLYGDLLHLLLYCFVSSTSLCIPVILSFSLTVPIGVHILLVFIWFTLNCLLPFSMVLFLLFPYSELNASSFFSIHNLAIVDITLWGPRFIWGVGKTFQILPPSGGFGTGPCDPGSCRVCTPKLKLTQSDKRLQGQDSFTVTLLLWVPDVICFSSLLSI